MINLKSEKGSITLFVLVSCMFLVASVACTQMYMQSKKIAVDREYRQIKSNYEGNSLDENVLKEDYERLAKNINMEINIVNVNHEDSKLSVEFKLNDTDINVNSIKYGWGTSEDEETVTKWTFIESSGVKENMLALNNEATNTGDYHLFVVINDKVLHSKITV